MKKGILAKKIGMTQVFAENGTLVPVTVLEAGPCLVVQKKTSERDGYEALQLGFGNIKPRQPKETPNKEVLKKKYKNPLRVNSPTIGHFKNAKAAVEANATEARAKLEEVKAAKAAALAEFEQTHPVAPDKNDPKYANAKPEVFERAMKSYNDAVKGFEYGKTKFAFDVDTELQKISFHYKKFLKEFKFDNVADYNVGDIIRADIFASGDKVDISGVSKGKGFQGPIKRHNQSRGPMSHGSKYHRGLGSMGASASPSRVKKGKKMAGQMGNVKVTIQNLEIVRTDANKDLILVKGAVPGAKGALLVIKESVKA